MAAEVDHLFYYLLGVSLFFTLLICALMVYFAVRYRRKSDDEFPRIDIQNIKLEITWCIVPFIFMLVMFFWGTELYARIKRPPEDAVTINVVGKQWMWKVQHPEACARSTRCTFPWASRIKLMMGSEDVIHSFFHPGVPHQAGCGAG